MDVNRISYLVYQTAMTGLDKLSFFIRRHADIATEVALAAIFLVGAFFYDVMTQWLFPKQLPPAPHNPLCICLKRDPFSFDEQVIGLSGISSDCARILMTHVTLASAGNLQKTCKRLNKLFQIQPFIHSPYFKHSCIAQEIYTTIFENQMLIFRKERAFEALVRFQIAVFRQDGDDDKLATLNRSTNIAFSIFHQIFVERLEEAKDQEFVNDQGWSSLPSRQLARIFLDLRYCDMLVRAINYQIFFHEHPDNWFLPLIGNVEVNAMTAFDSRERVYSNFRRMNFHDHLGQFFFTEYSKMPLKYCPTAENFDKKYFNYFNSFLTAEVNENSLPNRLHVSAMIKWGFIAANLLLHLELIGTKNYTESVTKCENFFSDSGEDLQSLLSAIQDQMRSELAVPNESAFNLDPNLWLHLISRS